MCFFFLRGLCFLNAVAKVLFYLARAMLVKTSWLHDAASE